MKLWTWLAIIAAAAGLIGLDIWWLVDASGGNTISGVVVEAGRRCSALPLAFGILGGHLFLKRGPGASFKASLALPVWLAVAVALQCVQIAQQAPAWLAPSALAIGVPLGWWLWPNHGAEGD